MFFAMGSLRRMIEDVSKQDAHSVRTKKSTSDDVTVLARDTRGRAMTANGGEQR
jgi:hypothetical protein